MKLEVCSYSGYKAYPGHGKRAVKGDGRSFFFLSAKCERSHFMKRNPRDINWTVLYRRKHKKGLSEAHAKKKTRKVAKTMRAIAGTSLADIVAKRNQDPNVRKAMRETAIKAIKEKKANDESKKKIKQASKKPIPTSTTIPKPKASKSGAKPMPKVSGKR